MAEGGHKDEYTYPDNEDNLEWWAETRMNIRDVRSMYSSINFYMKIWPGEPDRPEAKKKYLDNIKQQLFSMITEYNFCNHNIEEGNLPPGYTHDEIKDSDDT